MTAAQSVAKHVYGAAGAFTATVTITDASGRASTTSFPVQVTSPVGTWVFSGYLTRARRFEVRRLAFTSQDGRTLRGVLSAIDQRDRPVVATLSGERAVQVVVDTQRETLDGVLPGVLTGESSEFDLVARDGAIAGERLKFIALRNEPTGLTPEADLNMRFFSFSAPFAVQGFSPIRFDGSASRGAGLKYFIEFGDGASTIEPSAVHPIAKAGQYEARLTVVDRLGRTDRQEVPFKVISLVTDGYYHYWYGPWPIAPRTPCSERSSCEENTNLPDQKVLFDSQDGATLAGRILSDCCVHPFTGKLSGRNEIQFATIDGSDIVLTGTLYLAGRSDADWRLVLKQTTGGKGDGKFYDYYHRSGY